MVIQTSVDQMRTPSLTVNYLMDNFFEKLFVLFMKYLFLFGNSLKIYIHESVETDEFNIFSNKKEDHLWKKIGRIFYETMIDEYCV